MSNVEFHGFFARLVRLLEALAASQQSVRLAAHEAEAAAVAAPSLTQLKGRQDQIRAIDPKSVGKPAVVDGQLSVARNFRFLFLADLWCDGCRPASGHGRRDERVTDVHRHAVWPRQL